MEYISVIQFAEKHGISERTARNYCAGGKIGKTWNNYRGLREWGHTNGYLMDTCLSAQDQYKSLLNYFRIANK